MLAPNDRYFIVLDQDTNTLLTTRHAHYADAEDEASQLAAAHHGSPYVVLQAMAKAIPAIVLLEAGDDCPTYVVALYKP